MEWICGVLSAAIVAAVAFGYQIPVLGSGRAAFFVVMALGFAMCSKAMKLETYGWTNPFNVLGIIVGVVTLALAAVVLFKLQVPFITSDRIAILALAGTMALKIVIALVRGAVA